MSSIHSWGLVSAWALWAAIPTLAVEPDVASSRAPAAPAGATAADARLKAQPDCPHCLKAGLVPAQGAAAQGSGGPRPDPGVHVHGTTAVPRFDPVPPAGQAPTTAARGPVPSMLDVDVQQVQVPLLGESSRPRLPKSPASTAAAGQRTSSPAAPAPALEPDPSQRTASAPGVRLVSEAPSPAPAQTPATATASPPTAPAVLVPGEFERIPSTALAPTPQEASRIPNIPTTDESVLPPLPPDDEPETDLRFPSAPPAPPAIPDIPSSITMPKPEGMPEPVPLPDPSTISRTVLLPDPMASESPSATTPPLPAVNPGSEAMDRGTGPARVVASSEGAGPRARLLPSQGTMAAAGGGAVPYSAGIDTAAPGAAPPGPPATQEPWAGPMPAGAPADPGLNGFTYLPVMLGDQSPPSLNPGFLTGMPPVPRALGPAQPPTPPSPFARPARTNAFIPWARGFKIADNQSPMPQDRVFYSFNSFNNMNGDVNSRLGSSITSMQAYRELLGIEKTFWRGNASLGIRLPIDTLWTGSHDPSLRNNSTSVGNVTVFSKFLLWDNPATGNLVSGGLAVTAPTGPGSFAGSPTSSGFRDVQLQPYLGYILRRGDLYLQGFTAVDVATDSRDVTMWYNDLALGYFLYRSADPRAWLSAVVPTFEVHLNDPLNHRGAFRPNDPSGTPDVVDLTFGSSFIIRKRLVATVGCAFPVTGPHPFDFEALALLNFYYGRFGMATPWPMPPTGR